MLNFLERTSNFEAFLAKMIINLRDIVLALIGGIFFDEGREITERYEAILRAIAVGNNVPAKIASYILGMLSTSLTPSDVKSYLRILEKMGIIHRIKLFRKTDFYT